MSFERWYRDHHPRLVAALTIVAGDSSLGREAADEALVRAYERWSRVERMASPEAWTYSVGVNFLRRRARRLALEQKLLHRDAERAPLPPDVHADVWGAVRALPARQREAIALR